MRKRRKALSALSVAGVLVVGAIVMVLLISFKAEAARTDIQVTPRTVRTRALVAEPQTVTIVADGFLESARSLSIESPVAGRVVETRAGLKGGVQVEQGEVLLRLDDRRVRLAFDAAKADAIQAAMRFITAESLDSDEGVRWAAYVGELEDSAAARIPRLPDMNERQNLLAAAMGVVAARQALESAAIDWEDHIIVAPFSGILSGDGVAEGALVSPGEPLATLAENHRLELRLSLPAADLKQIAVGDAVKVSLQGVLSETVTSVARIEPILGSGSQMAKVYVTVETENESEWLPGSYVGAVIRGRTIDSAYRVPRSVLLNDRLPLYNSGRLALVPVTVLARDASDLIIAPNLPPDVELVETVLQNPVEGMILAKDLES